MAIAKLRGGIRNLLTRIEGRVENLLAILSMLSVALVVAGELIAPNSHIPWITTYWSDVLPWARAAIWLFFVVDFVAYAIVSNKPVEYARHHVLEFLICLCWLPYHGDGMLKHLFDGTYGNILTVEALQLIGTLAHCWRVVRWMGRRFSAHPMIVTGSAASVLIASAAALLNHFEPQTFPSFWDAVWYSLTTVTTIGYGDYVPHTAAGRIISSVLILGGISLAGVFLGVVSHTLTAKFKLSKLETKELSDKVEENNRLLRDVLEQLKRQNDIAERSLGEKPDGKSE